MTSPPAHTPSIWKRFWSPTSLLEQVPADASPAQAEAIRHRNNVWLKTYMDMYILRWGALWAATMVLAVLAADDDVPGLLFTAALAAAIGAFAGLAAMILTYRRAAKATGPSRP
ncbi:hypothetical protein QTH90_10730 [Variovorax sp. J2P1-59]|uniref:hypothetical protein n=1 Tax=Variovorax flavidus TaxID=3053501 RepID=UPI002577D4D3|nr:hypothetical protein [Variovorax sp. J2P1-59]MDM0074857.1 hypothetical protein [Variovorax sp. J2P1-59]